MAIAEDAWGHCATDTSSKVAIRKLGEIMAHELAGHQITSVARLLLGIWVAFFQECQQ